MKKIKNNLFPKIHSLTLGLLTGGLGIIAVYACNDLDGPKKCGEEQTPAMPTCIKITCGDEAKCNSYLVLQGQKECTPGLLPCVCVASFCGTMWVMSPSPNPVWEEVCDPAHILGPAPGSSQGGTLDVLSGDPCTDYPG